MYFFWFLAIGLAILGYFCLKEVIESKKGWNRLTAKERAVWGEEYIQAKEKKFKKNTAIGVAIITSSIICFIIAISIAKPSSTSNNKWDNLSNEEKQWYNENYGNGKSESIDNAIKDYRGY